MPPAIPGHCDNYKFPSISRYPFKGWCSVQLRRQHCLFTPCQQTQPSPLHTHWSSSVEAETPLFPLNPKVPWEWGRNGNHQLLHLLCCHFWIFKPFILPVFHHLRSSLSLSLSWGLSSLLSASGAKERAYHLLTETSEVIMTSTWHMVNT